MINYETKEMTEERHITGYHTHAKVLIGLLCLTTLTILIPWLDLSALTVLIALVIGSFAAYALGRVQFRGRMVVMYMVLAMTMFPQISILSGVFSIGTGENSTHEIWTYYYADGTMTVNLTDGFVARVSISYGPPKIPTSTRP